MAPGSVKTAGPVRGAATLAKAGPVDYRRCVCGLKLGSLMRSFLVTAVLLLGLLLSTGAEARRMGVYDYPFVSALAATVAATPPANQTTLLPRAQIAQRSEGRFLDVFPGRTVPPVFWYFDRGMPYVVLKQNKPKAPLFFVIGGTGAGADSSKSQTMANSLFQAGFHVVTPAQPDASELHGHGLVDQRAGQPRGGRAGSLPGHGHDRGRSQG